MEIGFDGFVEIGGVQPSDIGRKFSSNDHYVNEMRHSLLHNCCMGSLFTDIGLLFN
jgi:hypothetical protein